MNKIETFKNLVSRHDLTFSYSDDPRSFREGENSLQAIKRLAAEIDDPAVTNKIWNDNVDRYLAEGFRERFYW